MIKMVTKGVPKEVYQDWGIYQFWKEYDAIVQKLEAAPGKDLLDEEQF